ncbi:uncharacterized protein LOC134078383 [Sardina pilchardus]|uniref:uncharacterized protein LOC134078383 n=1 Tax=Sardina pilchardus TaxID=27697 RepID=UPI002E14CE2A
MEVLEEHDGICNASFNQSDVPRKDCWGVSYSSTSFCVLRGSTVDIPCTYGFPTDQTVNTTLWYREVEKGQDLIDLRLEEDYEGRVVHLSTEEHNCTLRIRDVRETDSGLYRFRYLTNKQGWHFSGGLVTISVTGTWQGSAIYAAIGIFIAVAILLLLGVLWLRKHKSSAPSTTGRTTISQQADSSPVYGNVLTSNPSSRRKAEADNSVKYASVRFKASDKSETGPFNSIEHPHTQTAQQNVPSKPLPAINHLCACPSSHLKSHPSDCPTIAIAFAIPMTALTSPAVVPCPNLWPSDPSDPSPSEITNGLLMDNLFPTLDYLNFHCHCNFQTTNDCTVTDPRQMGWALESWVCLRFLPICISNSREFFLAPVTHGLSLNV